MSATVLPVLRRNGTALIWLAAFAAVIAVCLAAKYFLTAGLAWQCPVMAALRIPCPSCGSTRAFAALCEFRFAEALAYNPMMILGIPAAPVVFSLRYKLAGSWIGWGIFATVVLANWIYLVLFLPR